MNGVKGKIPLSKLNEEKRIKEEEEEKKRKAKARRRARSKS